MAERRDALRGSGGSSLTYDSLGRLYEKRTIREDDKGTGEPVTGSLCLR